MTAFNAMLSIIRTSLLLILLCLFSACSEKEPTIQQQADKPTAAPQRSITREDCELRYTLPPATTPLNDPFEISLIATCGKPATVSVSTASLEETFIPALKTEQPETDGDRPFQQHFSLTLEPLWHGTVTIPEILVSFSFKDAPPVIIPIPETTVTVPPPTEAEQKNAIDDTAAVTPLRAAPASRTAVIATTAAVLLAAAAIVAAIIIRLRRRKTTKGVTRPVRRIPPHITALEQLDELLARKLVQQGLILPFYNRISEILRDYIEAQFSIRAPERTTEEFLDELRKNPDAFSQNHTTLLNNFLKHTDLVKYARVKPTQNDIDQTIAAATSFIRETIPAEQP